MTKKSDNLTLPMNFGERPKTDYTLELPNLEGFSEIGFDTETTTEDLLWDRTLTGFGVYTEGGPQCYVSIRHPGSNNFDEEAARRWAKDQLRNKTLIVANGKHEHHTMKKWGIDFEAQGCKFRDVFHAAALLSNKKRYQLNVNILMEEELPDWKRINARHQDLWQMPSSEVTPITIEDCAIAWELNKIYTPRISELELDNVLNLEDDIIFATCEMERNGSYLDIPLLLQYKREVTAELNARIMWFYRATGMAIKPTTGDDMSRLLRYYGINNPYRNEPTAENPEGSESFDEDAILNLIVDNPQHHEVLNMALEARQLASFKAKYIDAYIGSVQPDGRIYYALHQLRGDEGGTITGRYSSSKLFKKKQGGGCNIQQVAKTKKMPKLLQRWPIRKLFIPPAGRRHLSSDASQIEYRFFAHYASTVLSKDRLAKIYREDPKTDFHNVVMQWTGQIRDITKNINFRKLYGGGPAKGMMMINRENKLNHKPLITLDDAKDMDGKYDKEFPEAQQLLKVAESQARDYGFVRTLLGRRIYFDMDNPRERFYKALNMVLQGGATGDYVKLKIRHMHQERKSLNITMRSQVHDEINGDVESDEQKPIITEFMNEQEHPMQVPILWETGIGPNWEEAK